MVRRPSVQEAATLEETSSPPPAPVRVPSRDGLPLAATVYAPAGAPQPARAAVIAGALAVPQRFYRRFAAALAEAGWWVVTFDYRGIGASRTDREQEKTFRLRDWAQRDLAAMVDFAHAHCAPDSLVLVGHSFGGQAAGLIDNAERVDAMATIASQSGDWRLQAPRERPAIALHAHITLPLLARALGYVPWSRFGGGEDLPAGVAREWARWIRRSGYLWGDPTLLLTGYRAFAAPVRLYSIDDDHWGHEPAIEALCRAYPRVERVHLVPGALGLRSIGHFGFFRSASRALWPPLIEWMSGSRAEQPSEP